MPPTRKPQWDGSASARQTLLLIADQGFGDVIQFARYIPGRPSAARDIAIACSARCGRCCGRLRRPHGIRALGGRAGYRSLLPAVRPAATGAARASTRPAPMPYLRADPARTAQWAERLDGLVPRGLRRVGVIWAGRPTHNNDRNRSALLADFRPLASAARSCAAGIAEGPEDRPGRRAIIGRAPLINIGAEIEDYDDTMAILENLDLLVTVDTSVGASGRRDGAAGVDHAAARARWRWLLDRADTPWYPTLRLFRQTTVRRWDDVAQAIAAGLADAQLG